MWKPAAVVCLLTLGAAQAAGQTSTEDGIRAMLRGDYRGATRILRPLADDATGPDPVAQFFLAILYDTGHAGGDNARACRLFRQAASREHPFAEQAAALAGQLEAEFGGAASPLCRVEDTDRDRPLQPAAPARSAGLSAQGTAADGIAALAAGDATRAAAILRPIAEHAHTRDAAAHFVMAGLYDAGRGVPSDPLRACALYMRAGSRFDDPFGRQAMRLLGRSFERGAAFIEECQALANAGFDHGFEPVLFDLGPAHSVQLSLSTATVTYRGEVKRTPLPLAQPGIRGRPARYTELATGADRSVKRHFIEITFWLPVKRSWELYWSLFEVVGPELVSIAPGETLAVAQGESPPPPSAVDPAEYAMVRVDEDGHAEWAIVKGDRQRVERIESEAERQERRETALARDAALKRVDWNQRPDVRRPPSMNVTDAEGCGNVLVFGWSADRAESVLVRAAGIDLASAPQPVTFDLSLASPDVTITAFVYDRPQHRLDFCSDVMLSPRPADQEVWTAVGGTLTISLSPGSGGATRPRQAQATVVLNNLVLRNGEGKTVTVPRAVSMRALVGRVFG